MQPSAPSGGRGGAGREGGGGEGGRGRGGGEGDSDIRTKNKKTANSGSPRAEDVLPDLH